MDIEAIPGVGEKTAAALRDLEDPAAAIRDGDVAAVARASGLSTARAARIVRAGIQHAHGDPGGFAATPRAREIQERARELVAERTVTDDAACRLRALYPSPSRARIDEVRTLAERAMARDPDPAVRDALAGVSLPAEPGTVRVRDRCLATADAETYARAQAAVPELSVELVDDVRQLADLARGYAAVVALDEAFAGVDVEGDVSVEPDALERPAEVVPERPLAWFGTNRDRIRAAIAVHRRADLDPPCPLGELETTLDALDEDGNVCGDDDLDRLETAVDDLDAAVSMAENVANDRLREAIAERDVTIEGTDLLSLVERGAGADSLLARELADEYDAAVEAARDHLVDALALADTASLARRAFGGDPTFPVAHDEDAVARLREELTTARDRRATRRKREVASELAGRREDAITLLETALDLDVELAIARFASDFGCELPAFAGADDRRVDLTGARSPLLDVEAVDPIDYTVDGVRLLTGVNSGGKTATLDLLALVVTLAHMGLPVPADDAVVPRLDELHYHAKTQGTLDAGAFESTLREFAHLVTAVEADTDVLVLVDELESITEPGAAAVIVAGILESLADREALAVVVSHLAADIRAAADRPIGVDGIQATGIEDGSLAVDRSPVRGTLARSTPELIVETLAESEASSAERAFYRSLLEKFAD